MSEQPSAIANSFLLSLSAKSVTQALLAPLKGMDSFIFLIFFGKYPHGPLKNSFSLNNFIAFENFRYTKLPLPYKTKTWEA